MYAYWVYYKHALYSDGEYNYSDQLIYGTFIQAPIHLQDWLKISSVISNNCSWLYTKVIKDKNKLVNQINFSMSKIPYHFCQTHSAWPLCENCSHTAFSKSLLQCWAKASGSRWRSPCGGSPVTKCPTVNTWQKSTSLENIVFNMTIVLR